MNDDLTGLDHLVADLKSCGIKAAQKEAAYERIRAIKTLEYKAAGMPVGVIDKVVKGEESVNLALLEWRCAESEYKAAQEALNVRKIQVRERGNVARAEYFA